MYIRLNGEVSSVNITLDDYVSQLKATAFCSSQNKSAYTWDKYYQFGSDGASFENDQNLLNKVEQHALKM
jgi:hypothetical protein